MTNEELHEPYEYFHDKKLYCSICNIKDTNGFWNSEPWPCKASKKENQ